jgi:Family of unknown function (DUF5670)
MLLVLAGLLAVVWLIAFAIVHVPGIAIHTLLGLAAVSVLFHFVRARHYFATPTAPLPKDAVK